jgi:hypothetical protein
MFIRLSRLVVQTMEPGLAITIPVRKTVACKHVVCRCGKVLPTNLVVLPMFSYDVILRMDWLARHSVIIDCARKQVTLNPWGEGEVTYVGSRVRSLPPTISAILAKKLIIRGGQVFFTFVVTPTK